jgi:hypothetical protein
VETTNFPLQFPCRHPHRAQTRRFLIATQPPPGLTIFLRILESRYATALATTGFLYFIFQNLGTSMNICHPRITFPRVFYYLVTASRVAIFHL